MRKLLIAFLVLGVLGIFVAPVLAQQPLIIGTTDRVDELSFANSYDFFSWHVLRNTTGALTKLDPQTYKVVGDLAQSWDISSDGMVYTFHLRPNLTFWDGAPCDAAAVKWSLDRTMKLDGPKGGVGLIKPYIKSIDVVDPLTVKITLTQPDAVFLLRISSQIGASLIYSPKTTPADTFAKGVYAGTGPYKLIKYVPDQYVQYEAYSGYYGPAPKSKYIIEKFYSNSAALRAAIEAGDIDVAFRSLNPQDILSMEKEKNVNIHIYTPSPGIRYMLFNVTKPPFDNPLVRQAISYAVDRNAICQQVFSGINTPIYTMVPDVDPPFFGAYPCFPKRDVAKAKAMLSELGYSADNPLTINLWYTPKHYGSTEADAATVIKGSLEQTGLIKVTLQSMEVSAYFDAMSKGQFGMFLLGWYPDYPEPSNYLAPWTVESPKALGTFFNEDPNYLAYKDILDVATTTVDPAVRAKLYQAIQVMSVQDVPWIPLWSINGQMAVATLPSVHGATVDITMDLHIADIYKD
jgi:peptide/nickel transport system substrate-binding protein